MVKSKIDIALEALTRWIGLTGLNLESAVTEAKLFTTRRKLDLLTFGLRGVEIGLSKTLKYLGVWYDGKLDFREHFRKVAEKANRIVERLSCLMRNIKSLEKVRKIPENVRMTVVCMEPHFGPTM